MNLENGQIYYINFNGNWGKEINNIHLGVIYKLPSIKDLVLCIPLTSPKIKHFKTNDNFNNRNYKNIKHFNWQYLKQTDSIALLDQMKTISIGRILNPFKNQSKNVIILNNNTQKILKEKIRQYINLILYKKKNTI